MVKFTKDLAYRIEQVEMNYINSRFERFKGYDNNAFGVKILKYGAASAFIIPEWPKYRYGNRVLGMGHDEVEYIEEIISEFEKDHLPFTFETQPGRYSPALGKKLQRYKFYPTGFSTAVYTDSPTLGPSSNPDISIRKVEINELDEFLDFYQEGFGFELYPKSQKEVIRHWLEEAMRDDKYILYYALLDGKVAAVATMYFDDDIAMLSNSTTLVDYRRQGCQSKLIAERIRDAKNRGRDMFVSFVDYGSTAHLNLDKYGFKIAYTKPIWSR